MRWTGQVSWFCFFVVPRVLADAYIRLSRVCVVVQFCAFFLYLFAVRGVKRDCAPSSRLTTTCSPHVVALKVHPMILFTLSVLPPSIHPSSLLSRHLMFLFLVTPAPSAVPPDRHPSSISTLLATL